MIIQDDWMENVELRKDGKEKEGDGRNKSDDFREGNVGNVEL